MARSFVTGGLLLAAVALLLLLNSFLGLGLGSVLLGVALGGVLGLVPGGAVGRAGAFLVGFILAVVGYLVRVLLLNDTGLGLFLFALFVIGIATLLAGLTKGRMPLAAGLLGAAAVVGGYEVLFNLAPQNITAELVPAASAVLLPAALAFFAATLAQLIAPDEQPEASAAASYRNDEYSEVR
jgi:hypothetical protein